VVNGEPKGPKPKAESRGEVLGEGQPAPSPPARDLGAVNSPKKGFLHSRDAR